MPGTGDNGLIPAFNGIIAIGSDGKLTLEGESDANARTVHFMYGGTVAMSINNNDLSSSEVAYTPSQLSFALWGQLPYESSNLNIDDTYHTYAKVKDGYGDPCRLVGIASADINESNFDNGLWRLPTNAEYIDATHSDWVTKNKIGGRNVTIKGQAYFHPASGYRPASNSGIVALESGVYLSNTFATGTNRADFYRFVQANDNSSPNPNYPQDRNYGYPVRCVPQEKKVVPGIGVDYSIPAFNHIIAIGSDGKLTVTAEDNDKDARLVYFKFGSVIALSCANEWSSKEVAYNPSKLSLDVLNTWEGVPYWIGTTVVGSVSHNAQTVSEGMGDPCRLVGLTDDDISSGKVDNGEWRLPTQEEHEGAEAEPLEANNYSGFHEYNGYKGRYIALVNSTFTKPVFYPAVTIRTANGIDSGEYGRYSTSTSLWSGGSILHFYYGVLVSVNHVALNVCYTVRCVP